MRHYKSHFKGKVVYCNCDDPRISNFFHYFSYNFEKLGLSRLITTCYRNTDPETFSNHDTPRAIYLEYTGNKGAEGVPDPSQIGIRELEGDGDFRSGESIELLKQADIVVTNPPFSLFREYVSQLMEYGKQFIIIGNKNAITYKEIFKYIKEEKMWLGYRNINSDMWFLLPDSSDKWEKMENGKKLQHIMGCWFTNIDTTKRHEDIILYKTYSPEDYPDFDNYHAINVNKVAEIPVDYPGPMGVPITFMDKFNPEQFEIISAN
ncbi:MAG: adenine-specific methyltransferase EcoRI family protein, partial [Alistipes sp.]|nr:adenine-specific methyltransferase EcoRI family protein [Alistipes sp.]